MPHECMINFYNPDILMLHEANMDIQFVTDMYSCATYIVNYLNKSNSAMSKLLREAAAEIRLGNNAMKDQMRALAHCFLNASEFSAQEAVYYILGLSVSSCSRKCVFINTNRPENRVVVCKNTAAMENLPKNSYDIYVKSNLDHYIQRPLKIENCTLADFVANYEFSTTCKKQKSNETSTQDNSDVSEDEEEEDESHPMPLLDDSGFVRRRKSSKVIRYCNYNEQSPDYIRENVMLFWPWRNEQEMMDSAEETYRLRENEIREARRQYVYKDKFLEDLQNAAQANYNEDDVDNADSQYNSPQNLRIFQAIDSQTAALPDRDIEKVAPANEDTNRDEFMVPIPKMLNEEDYSRIVSSLNKKQHMFLLHVLHQMKENKGPCHYLVQGKAGCGKSRLIESLHQSLLRYYNAGSEQLDSLKVLLCAFTGKASFAIKGTTIHSAFSLPVSQSKEMVPLSSATRNTLLSKMRDLKLIIIDEISFVSSRIFQQIDARLKQIFNDSSDTPFAGLSVIVFGDFNQLAPVAGQYIFEPNQQETYCDLIGNPLWDLFTSYELTEIMRQKDDLPFAQALSNLAIGKMSKEEVSLLQTRQVSPDTVPKEAIRLFTKNEEVDQYNMSIINKDPSKLCSVATDSVTGEPNETTRERLLKAAEKAETKKCQGLPYRLYLSLNIKYMITINVNVVDGLVNGAVGVLKQIELDGEKVTRVWMCFPEENIGLDRRRQIPHSSDPRLIAIDRVIRTFQPFKNRHSVTRSQLPLVPAEAQTFHKSQGSTYESVAVQLKPGLQRSYLYVALSRCTKLSGLYLIGNFNPPAPPGLKDKVGPELKRLESKPVIMSCLFPSEYPQDLTVVYHNIQSMHETSHWADFTNYMQLQKPSVFIAAETWTLAGDHLEIDNYVIAFRIDCASRRHGFGLLIYIRSGVEYRVLSTTHNEERSASFCFAALLIQGLGIFSGYKPPSTPFSNIKKDFESALDAVSNASSQCIVLGDFNIDVKSTDANKTFLSLLQNKGFNNQLSPETSTTNLGTGIDCIFSNFNHLAGVSESFFSYHKQLVVVPSRQPQAAAPTHLRTNVLPAIQPPPPAPRLPTTKQPAKNNAAKPPIATPKPAGTSSSSSENLTLASAIAAGNSLHSSLMRTKSADSNDIKTMKKLLLFLQQCGTAKRQGKEAMFLLRKSIRYALKPIATLGNGDCFYNAISLQLCGNEKLAKGLRALVAYHININETFLEDLPVLMGQHPPWTTILKCGEYAEFAETIVMSYLLNRPLNIYGDKDASSLRINQSTGSDLNVYLDLAGRHYSSLEKRGKKIAPAPNPIKNLPRRIKFISVETMVDAVVGIPVARNPLKNAI